MLAKFLRSHSCNRKKLFAQDILRVHVRQVQSRPHSVPEFVGTFLSDSHGHVTSKYYPQTSFRSRYDTRRTRSSRGCKPSDCHEYRAWCDESVCSSRFQNRNGASGSRHGSFPDGGNASTCVKRKASCLYHSFLYSDTSIEGFPLNTISTAVCSPCACTASNESREIIL